MNNIPLRILSGNTQAIRRNTQKHPIKNPKQKHPAPVLQAARFGFRFLSTTR